MKLRHFLITSAVTACAWQSAQAADTASVAQDDQPAAETAPQNILVVGDTQHLPQSFDQRYATTQVLTRADLDRLSPVEPGVAQALATLPGVTISQTGGPGSATSVSIRGSSSTQIAVFIDGVRVGSSTLGTAEWADLPTSQFERIEVISGPAAASFGADAMGGVIQLFTRYASNQPNQTTVSFGGGTHNTYDTQVRTSGTIASTGPLAALSGLTYALDLHDYNTDGIVAVPPWNAGYSARNPYHAQDVSGRLGYAHDNWSISTFALYHDSNYAFTTFDPTQPTEKQIDRQLTTGAHFHLDVSPFTQFDQSIGYATDNMWTSGDPGYAMAPDSIESTRLTTSTALTHQEHGGTLFGLPLSGETKLAYDFTREMAFAPNDFPGGVPPRNDSAVSLHQSVTLDALTLFLAGRHEVVQGYSVNTGNVALAYALSPVYTARVSYGNAFHLPTFDQLYYPCSFGYCPNPNLGPERSDSVELAFDANTAYGKFTAAVYDTRVHGLITNELVDPVNFIYMPVNINRAHIQGIDLSYKGMLGASTPVSASIGLLNPKDVTDQTWLPLRPRQTFNLSIDHAWDELHLHALSTGLSLQYGGTSMDTDLNGNQIALPSYLLVNLRAAWQINQKLLLSAYLSNLFNRQYVTTYGYNSLGRTAFGKISYTF
jgi:vitamin B12 transporter